MTTFSTNFGDRLSTVHLRGQNHMTADEVVFSNDECRLACNDWHGGIIDIWDVSHQTLVMQLTQIHGAMIAFGAGDTLFAACTTSGIYIWRLPQQIPICHVAWPPEIRYFRPMFLSFISADTQLMIGFGNCLVIFDLTSKRILDCIRATDSSECCMMRVVRFGDSPYVYFAEQTPHGTRFVVRDVMAQQSRFAVEMEENDDYRLSANGFLLLILRNNERIAEIWNLPAGVMVRRIPFGGLWPMSRFAVVDNYLAYSYYEISNGRQSDNAILEMWDLSRGMCVQSCQNLFSTEFVWSAEGGIMAIMNFTEPYLLPEKSVALFIDPLAGNIKGHALWHRGHTIETYGFSPSGRWFSSIFTFESSGRQGAIIPAGTIALTDLMSILPPHEAATKSCSA